MWGTWTDQAGQAPLGPPFFPCQLSQLSQNKSLQGHMVNHRRKTSCVCNDARKEKKKKLYIYIFFSWGSLPTLATRQPLDTTQPDGKDDGKTRNEWEDQHTWVLRLKKPPGLFLNKNSVAVWAWRALLLRCCLYQIRFDGVFLTLSITFITGFLQISIHHNRISI